MKRTGVPIGHAFFDDVNKGVHLVDYSLPTNMLPIIRIATRNDIPGMHHVRRAVRENRLTSMVITEAHYIPAIEDTGRGWVAEENGAVLGFAVGNKMTGNIWALFVDPAHEGRGLGRALHDTMVDWLFAEGLTKLWLGTEPNTRAYQFYGRAGWTFMGLLPDGDALFEICRAQKTPNHLTTSGGRSGDCS